MADFAPTTSQKNATDTRGSAVLVSAGAGSGKTRVLTERLMGYVCGENGVDVDSFLVITFTKAAAAELRGRISEELAARLAADPSNRRLRRQSALCQRAQISTIHGFCAALLRENCQKLGISPDFRIADEQRCEAMRIAALERVMEKRYEEAEKHPYFTALVDTVGAGRDDRRLSELVLKLHGRMQCHARPGQWAKKQAELLKTPASDLSETPWGREITDWAAGICDYWIREYDAMLKTIADDDKLSAAYMSAFSSDGDSLRELRRTLDKGWDKTRRLLPMSFEKLKALRNYPDKAIPDRLKDRRDKMKKDVKKIETGFADDSALLLDELKSTADAMEELLNLTLDFDRAYRQDKRSRSLVDYSDLEHLAAELLTNEDGTANDFARELSKRYTEIMVDEYQDVSRVQETIFRAVSREGKNLFMVGDVKQSIYRFRLADPTIFTEKYTSYAPFETARGDEPRRILLRENFRSRREITEGANCVFGACMSRTLGDVDYDDAAALRFGATYFGGEVPVPELMLLEIPKNEDGDEESPDKTALEARFVAGRIEELMQSGMTVGAEGKERPLQYGDIAILMRSANSVGSVYKRALAERGIPVGNVRGCGFFTSSEVSAVISMLSVMDNPHKDIPLIAVLRSGSFGFTPDELSEIRGAERGADFYTALCKSAETSEKCRSFLALLSSLRTLAADMSASELTWEVIEAMDMTAICSAMSDGRQRRANLMALIELSESFSQTGYRGLHRYVMWLRALADKGEEPSTGGSFMSAVQIMTIHRSKGLEFPVVFLCDTARKMNFSDTAETVLVHSELGLGPKLVDTEKRVQYPTVARTAISTRMRRETASEEMRLLYVALTRAKERLFVTATMKNPYEKIEKMRGDVSFPMAAELLQRSASVASWLIYACLADGERHFKLSVHEHTESVERGAETGRCAEADMDAAAELERRLAFVYPYSAAVELPSKITATELKGREEKDGDAESLVKRTSYAFRMPELTGGKRPLTPTERGIATHLVLQYMNFSEGVSRAGIEREIERLRRESFISEREAEAVSAANIEKLFASRLGKRMLKAEKPLREFRFSILTDAELLNPDAAGEQLLMQGVVDCCIEEEDSLVVIDYKTDSVRTPEEISARAELYRGQLMAYASALERIFGKRVKECIIYFIKAGKDISVYKA